MLKDEFYRRGLLRQMHELRSEQALPGASERAANVLLQKLGWAAAPAKPISVESVAATVTRRAA
jgi:hypothetical protein